MSLSPSGNDLSWWPGFHNQLYNVGKQAIDWERQSRDVVEWVQANRYILGEPWSYESTGPKIEYGDYDIVHDKLPRPYLIDFVRDQTPEKSVIKNRQSELTENHINEELFYCMTRPHTRVSHLFPSNELGDSISNEKISPAISESPKIKPHLLGTGAVRRYPFDNGSMLTVNGVLQKAGGRAASRDILIFDEVDSMPESIFGVYEELLSHSPMKFIRKISTPTVPQVGIDRVVRTGSEFEWIITCPKCKRKQIFTWPDSIINYFELSEYDIDDPKYVKRLNKTYLGCRYCKEYIDRGGKQYLGTAQWIPKKPELIGRHNSYYINVGMIPWKTGREITRRMHELADYAHQAINEVWGLAYMMSDQQLSEADVKACVRPWGMMSTRMAAMTNVSIGIDWGKKHSYLVVSANGVEAARPHKRCVVYVEDICEKTLKQHGFGKETTEHVKRARQIADLFGMDALVSDANGLGVDRNAYLIKCFPKRAWGCFYDTAEEGNQIRKSKLQIPLWTEVQRRVTVSKVNAWKEIIGEFRRQAIGIPNNKEQTGMVNMFIKHQLALGIQPRWSTTYEREFEVCIRMHPQDHFANAHLYSKLAWDKLTGNRFSNVPGVVVKRSVPGVNTPQRPV